MIAPIRGLNSSVDGLRRQGEHIAHDANTINRAFTAAQNAQAADSVSVSHTASIAPAVEDAVRGAVLSHEGDLTSALTHLLQARAAYGSTLATTKVTADVESDLARLLRKHDV